MIYRIEGKRQRDVLRARTRMKDHTLIGESQDGTFAIVETRFPERTGRFGLFSVTEVEGQTETIPEAQDQTGPESLVPGL